MSLEDLRIQIDSIDDKIIELYKERMEVCKNVGIIKAKENKNVLNAGREKEIIYRLSSKVDDELKLYVKELYEVMFSTSKAYQSHYVNNTSKTVLEIEKLLNDGLRDFPTMANVACQGVEGANSMVATEKLFPISDITYFKTFEGVFSAVEKGLCDFGVLPIENSTAGSVSEVYDLMKKYNFSIVRSVRLKINHCIAVARGNSLKNVKKVVSHQQALMQCSDYLKNLNVETQNEENTAVCAKRLSESNGNEIAVICSEDCANHYGLEVVEKNIQNYGNNYTRFICISRELKLYKGDNKISIMTSLSHTPGSLSRILTRFYSLGLNLTKIESRPLLKSEFDFMFYFDFEGDISDKKVRNLISDLQNSSDNFVFLGSYKEVL